MSNHNINKDEIKNMVLFETKERGEELLKERFPTKYIDIQIFPNNDALITVGDQKIEIKTGDVV